MSLFNRIQNYLIDRIIDIEEERECVITISYDDQRRIDKAIEEIAEIIECSCHSKEPDPDAKYEEKRLEKFEK